MSQTQKRRIGFFLAPVVTITACMVAFMHYSGAEAAPPRRGPSLGDGAPSLGVLPISQPQPVAPPQDLLPLLIGPVPGLTTAWHIAPPHTAISLGTVVEFKKDGLSVSQITWSGALEVRQEGDDSIAECSLQALGTSVVTVTVTRPGGYQREYRCELQVVDTPVDAITLAPLEVSAVPLQIDENSPDLNDQTKFYFFMSPSIAGVVQTGVGQYRTSINRRLSLSVEVVPPGFAPLIEWRLNGNTVLGTSGMLAAGPVVGTQTIAAGPMLNPSEAQLETYSVTITSHVSGQDIIPDGEPVTFTAVTDPPGYEADITWMSSTQVGTGSPVFGTGPTFTVQFDDTWDPYPEGGSWQWLGVRADNTRFNQDQKTGVCCRLDLEACTIQTELECTLAAGVFLGVNSACEDMDEAQDELLLPPPLRAACAAGISVSTSKRRCCDIPTPFDDTRKTITVTAAAVPAGGATIRVSIAGQADCTAIVVPGATVLECHYGPCLPAGTLTNVSIIGAGPAFPVLCTDTFRQTN